jgi:hypothetical protein
MPLAEAHDPKFCAPFAATIRQGTSELVPVPGFSPDDVEIVEAPHVLAAKVATAEGTAIVLTALHGAMLGSEHLLLDLKSNGVTTRRDVGYIVTQIAVFQDPRTGNNKARGNPDEPFLTLARAAEEAEDGDTIEILSSPSVDFTAMSVATAPPIAIRAGVTIKGVDDQATIRLDDRLDLQGDATISRMRLGKRLVVTRPASRVSLRNVFAEGGVTVDAGATNASLTIGGSPTEIRSDNDSRTNKPNPDGPIAVFATGAKVRVESGVSVLPTGVAQTAGVAIRLTGAGQSFVMLDSTVSNSSGAVTSVSLPGASDVNIQRSNIAGRVDITSPDANATIANTSFFSGQGGGVLFKGKTMLLTGSKLTGVPVEQGNQGSRVTVRNTLFLEYQAFAYRLYDGFLDLGNEQESGANTFVKSATVAAGAALDIEEPSRPDNGVSVRGATFDCQPILTDFTAPGPTPPPANSIYYIANPGVAIHFIP